MLWIALQAWSEGGEGATPAAPRPGTLQALAWQALAYTPRVSLAPDAVLMEVAASLRLFGGLRGLLVALQDDVRDLLKPERLRAAQGTTALGALGRLRLGRPWRESSRVALVDLPLLVFSAAQPHLAVLERLGCRSWGDVRQLPREGVARRFGQGLLDALDQAFGERPESHTWLQLPEVFDDRLELPAVVEHSAGLVFALQRLLLRLRLWLVARSHGVLALRVVWQLDARRGTDRSGELVLRLSEATQDVAHIARLAAERLAHIELPAPAQALALRTLETVALQVQSRSLLPEEQHQGDSFAQLVERLSARLGPEKVQRWQGLARHVPERMQQWQPAPPLVVGQPGGRKGASGGGRLHGTNRREGSAPTAVERAAPFPVGAQPLGESGRAAGISPRQESPRELVPYSARENGSPSVGAQPLGESHRAAGVSPRRTSPKARGIYRETTSSSLMPTWLLHSPLPLRVRGDRPWYEGPLTLLVGPQRLETSGWHGASPAQAEHPRPTEAPVMRDYFIARSDQAGLLWVFRERLPRTPERPEALAGWFLHGIFA